MRGERAGSQSGCTVQLQEAEPSPPPLSTATMPAVAVTGASAWRGGAQRAIAIETVLGGGGAAMIWAKAA